jgi:hypothetical protein
MSPLTLTSEKKWTSYALAGGAILIAPAAKANLITFTQTISLDSSSQTQADLDVNLDGTPDFTLVVSGPGAAVGSRFTQIEAYAGSTNLIFVDANPFDFASVVPLGSAPSPTDLTASSAYFLRDKKGLSGSNKIKGNWNNGLTNFQYTGLEFTAGTNTYMGWAEVSVEIGSAKLMVIQSAYDDTPLTPEPSSMALMLLGAAGVAALKLRRRSAQ